MKSMDTSRQRCAVVVGLTVALVLTLTPAAEGKPKPKDIVFDQTFAGVLINTIQYVPPGGAPTASTMGLFEGKGSPGPTTTRTFGGRSGAPDFAICAAAPMDQKACSDCCAGASSPNCLSFPITENPLVFTFTDDLSLLFAGGTGEVCVDLITGRSTGTIDIMFTGGRGRFEGAKGDAVVVFETQPISADGSFAGETGRTVGTIELD